MWSAGQIPVFAAAPDQWRIFIVPAAQIDAELRNQRDLFAGP